MQATPCIRFRERGAARRCGRSGRVPLILVEVNEESKEAGVGFPRVKEVNVIPILLPFAVVHNLELFRARFRAAVLQLRVVDPKRVREAREDDVVQDSVRIAREPALARCAGLV